MKLDIKEQKVLSYIHLKADATLSEIAKATKLQSHTVRYILDSFLKKKLLIPNTIINKRALGFYTASSYFNFRSNKIKQKEEILDYMIKSNLVCWLSPVIGDYEYGLSLAIKNLDQANLFFTEIGKVYGSIFEERTFAIDREWFYFGKKYLMPFKDKSSYIKVDNSIGEVKIDDTDKKIINLLLRHPLSSESIICETLKIPSSTVNARIHKLKKSKVINGYFYLLNYVNTNTSAYRVIIDLGGLQTSVVNKIIKFSNEHPHVVSMDTCFGCYDIELSVEYQDSYSIKNFIENLRSNFNEDIVRLKVVNRLDDLKYFNISELAFEN